MSWGQHKTSYEGGLGDTEVALRKSGSRHLVTAKVLGRDTTPEGETIVWLDRLVVEPGEIQLNATWRARGAISTILVGSVT